MKIRALIVYMIGALHSSPHKISKLPIDWGCRCAFWVTIPRGSRTNKPGTSNFSIFWRVDWVPRRLLWH